MRRSPGNYLYQRILKHRLRAMFILAVCGGMIFGVELQKWLPNWATFAWIAILTLTLIWVFSTFFRGRWRIQNMEKGLFAERSIGQAIDFAIAVPGCAAVHNVTSIAEAGDIDHLVITPARLWVIETKANRVPPKEFPKSLRKIGRNVKAVREWAGSKTEVQGCLVIQSDDKNKGRNEYDVQGSKDKIKKKNLSSLVSELQSEARRQKSSNEDLVQRVWRLGNEL